MINLKSSINTNKFGLQNQCHKGHNLKKKYPYIRMGTFMSMNITDSFFHGAAFLNTKKTQNDKN